MGSLASCAGWQDTRDAAKKAKERAHAQWLAGLLECDAAGNLEFRQLTSERALGRARALLTGGPRGLRRQFRKAGKRAAVAWARREHQGGRSWGSCAAALGVSAASLHAWRCEHPDEPPAPSWVAVWVVDDEIRFWGTREAGPLPTICDASTVTQWAQIRVQGYADLRIAQLQAHEEPQLDMPLRLEDGPAKQRQPRRVLAHVIDAGDTNYRAWRCRKCKREWSCHYDDDPPVPYREPCGHCGPTWGALPSHGVHVTAQPRQTEAADG